MSSRDLPRSLAALAARIRRCTLCELHGSRTRAVPGEGPARSHILLVGEAPGRTEDETGAPFRGVGGKLLDRALGEAGIRRDRVFITNAVKCRPPGNRKPHAGEVRTCRPYLVAQIAAVRPRVIGALGQTAAHDLLGTEASLARVRGRWRRFEGRPVVSTYHPAAVLYNRRLYRALVRDLRSAKRRSEAT